MAVTKPLSKEIARAYIAPYDSWRNRVAINAFVRDIPLDPGHPSYATLVEVEKGLGAIKERNVPMLLLWGGRDFCFDKVFYREWRDRFPQAQTHFFADGGHYVLEDKQAEIASLLLDFFQGDVPVQGRGV